MGFGNAIRRDDGVGLYVVNAVRARVGLPQLTADEDGLDDLGHPVDAVALHQLLPELADTVADYSTVVFVDAHTGTVPEDVRVVPVEEGYGFQAVTHHMSPGMLLSLARLATGSSPAGHLVSVRGESFDLGTQLTDGCRRRADEAVAEVLRLIGLAAS